MREGPELAGVRAHKYAQQTCPSCTRYSGSKRSVQRTTDVPRRSREHPPARRSLSRKKADARRKDLSYLDSGPQGKLESLERRIAPLASSPLSRTKRSDQ